MTAARTRCSSPRFAALAAAVAVGVTGAATPARAADHLFVLTSNAQPSLSGGGSCATVTLDSTPTAAVNLEKTGEQATVRSFFGLHWVVNHGAPATVQVLDPATFDTIHEYPVGAGTDPRDIVVVDGTSAYVSRRDSRWLLEVHPLTGAAVDSVDMGPFADADLLPEMAWMALDGNRLFVQLQRIDRNVTGTTVPPAMLAVVDVTTNELVDADPVAPGVQAIALQGSVPRGKMQLEGRRLYVTATGGFLGLPGGIEEVDLDALTSLGYLVSEDEFALDIGGFLFVSPTRGYLLGHTDFALSSHLDMFSRPEGTFIRECVVTFDLVTEIAFDEVTNRVYFPDPEVGVRVVDAATGDTLGVPVSTGLPPRDLIVFRSGGATAAERTLRPGSAELNVAPSPFVDRTTVAWRANSPGTVTITIFDVTGRVVRRLAPRAVAASVVWDGRDEAGRGVAGGVYFLRAEIDGRRTTRTVLRVR